MADDNDKPTLNRRRVLGGMATIGAAGALGSGSWAYFYDNEASKGNEFVAGELDLALSWNTSYHGAPGASFQDKAGSGGPIFTLEDVKPGDWGEATIEMDVNGNPAYVTLDGVITARLENTENEPEKKVDDSPGGELDNKIMAQMWYDTNCDNDIDGGGEQTQGEPADVVIVFDKSGSMSGEITEAQNGALQLINALGANDQVGVVSFSTNAGDGSGTSTSPDQALTTNKQAARDEINSLNATALTNMEAGVELAHEELLQGDQFTGDYNGSGNARSGVRKIMVFLGDGAPTAHTDVTDSNNNSPVQEASNAKGDGIEIYTIAYDAPGATADQLLEDMASGPSYSFDADVSDVVDVFEQIGSVVSGGGEQVFASGTLNQVMAQLDGSGLNGDLPSGCYSSGPHCIGFEWWLPDDVGNVVQSDSVKFDLTFRAEQCRHQYVEPSANDHDAVPSNRQSSGNQSSGNQTA